MGTSGPKLFDGGNTPRHFSAALYEDGSVRHWCVISYGNSVTFSDSATRSPQIASTNIIWGYTNSFAGSPVYPTAYSRGTKLAADYASSIIPLDFQTGQVLDPTGGAATNLLPFVTNNIVGYHYNYTNSSANGQTNLALRIQYQNPIVAFGSRTGGSTLYTERSYRFVSYAGCPTFTNDYRFSSNIPMPCRSRFIQKRILPW
jgi:hypothetical protein